MTPSRCGTWGAASWPGIGRAEVIKPYRTQRLTKDGRMALRRRAEAKAREKAGEMPVGTDALSPKEARRLVHDLRVHQIELEMQNEELRRAQSEIEASRARYFDLYDLAPVGYFTLSEKGLILEANLTAAKLLGVERRPLVKQPLTRFILPEDQDIYYLRLKELLKTGSPQACEIRMLRPNAAPFWARVEAAAGRSADGSRLCRAVMSDTTESKSAQERKLVLRRLMRAREEEKRRLASALHEAIGSMVVSLSSSLLLVEDAVKGGRSDRAISRLSRTKEMVKGLAAMLKKVCTDIRPPALDISGLSGAITELAPQFRDHTGIKLRHAVDLPDGGKAIDDSVAIVIYRLAQESLNNLAKYSKARNAQIVIKQDGGKVTLAISDDGCGFDAHRPQSKTSLGFRIMQEEAESVGGNLLIDSRPGRGTLIKAEFPRRLPPNPELGP
ncbi:MAG: PAS domain S-box protein [Elusimicrobia bacterium]|nr:PAS domain S-box protein [Elusimicrobiota bacterium]